MPLRKSMPKRRRVARPAKMARKRRMGANGVPDIASLTEAYTRVISSQQPTQNALSYNNLTLAQVDFKRAQGVAQYYQFFRIRKVTYTYKPTFDTFINGGVSSIPYVYWSINKTGEAQLLNQSSLVARGAKPLRLDDKAVVVSYTPTVGSQTVSTSSLSNNAGAYLTSPWLTTDNLTMTSLWSPSTVQHFGHYAMITCTGSLNFEVQVDVEFEFKKPRVLPNLSQDPIIEFFDDQVIEPSPSAL